ncbi:MAG TPA: hypothetical protein PKW95_02535 [bacterium]|nr:hypothetical protein [bacterium]
MNEIELLIIKFVVSIFIVLLLSFIAEHVSPKWAGILSGFPTGSAITLHFFALENGLTFAGESAIYNMVGLVAMQMFIFSYYLCGVKLKRYKIIMSTIGGFIGYTITISLISRLPINPYLATIIPIISFFIFKSSFKKIIHSTIGEKIKPTCKVIISRSGIAAITICLITGVAEIVGSTWAGLFSAFPTTLFPLILIIHYSYGEQYAHSIIKHVPDGLGGLLTYSLILYLSYPSISLYLGIALAFSGALSYLLLYSLLQKNLAKPNSL